MSFTDKQLTDLTAKLDASHVKEREQGKQKLSYIEGWHVIAEANRIFGFDNWDRVTLETTRVAERERKIGRDQYQKDGWGVTYTARVRVTVRAGDALIVREGVGSGHGIDADLGLAHESAIKEAETDAMKRALMTFGNPFGLALYDKSRENVENAAPVQQQRQQPAPARQQTKQQPAGIDEVRQKAVAFKDDFIKRVTRCGNLDELRLLKAGADDAKKLQFLADKHRDLWDDVQSAIAKHETTILERAAA